MCCFVFSFQWNESPKVIWASAKLARDQPCALVHLGQTPHRLSALLAQQLQLTHCPDCSKIPYLVLMQLTYPLPVHATIMMLCFLVTPGKQPQPLVHDHALRQLHLVHKRRFSLTPFSSHYQHHNSDWSGQQLRPVANSLHWDESHLQPVEHVAPHPEQAQLRTLAQLLWQRQLNSTWRHLTEACHGFHVLCTLNQILLLIRESQQKATLPEMLGSPVL